MLLVVTLRGRFCCCKHLLTRNLKRHLDRPDSQNYPGDQTELISNAVLGAHFK